MFSAWDWNSWLLSVGFELFIFGLLTSFSATMTAIMFRMWGETCCDTATIRLRRTVKEPPIRKSA